MNLLVFRLQGNYRKEMWKYKTLLSSAFNKRRKSQVSSKRVKINVLALDPVSAVHEVIAAVQTIWKTSFRRVTTTFTKLAAMLPIKFSSCSNLIPPVYQTMRNGRKSLTRDIFKLMDLVLFLFVQYHILNQII